MTEKDANKAVETIAETIREMADAVKLNADTYAKLAAHGKYATILLHLSADDIPQIKYIANENYIHSPVLSEELQKFWNERKELEQK